MRRIANARKVWIEAHEHYSKQSYRSRCRILGANGLEELSIPVLKTHGTKQAVHTVKTNEEENWRKKHWGALQAAYGKSAFWMHYRHRLEPIYFRQDLTCLLEFNMALLHDLMSMLRIQTPVLLTEDYHKQPKGISDLRPYFDAKHPNPALLDEEKSLKFYPQVFAEKFSFTPNLSVLDLLMNCGPDSAEYLLDN